MTDYDGGDIMRSMSKKRKHQTDLGKQLREAFAKSGLSRFALANQAGVPYAGVHRFMGDDRDITLNTASRLAAVLGLELRPVQRKTGKKKSR